jgi:hypothetical protein
MSPNIITLLLSVESHQKGLAFVSMAQHFLKNMLETDLATLLPALTYISRFFGLESS